MEGHTWANERETAIRADTPRPDDMWPETFNRLGRRAQKKVIEQWVPEKKRRTKLRRAKGVQEQGAGLVPKSKNKELREMLDAASEKYKPLVAPAMPVISVSENGGAASSVIREAAPTSSDEERKAARAAKAKLNRLRQNARKTKLKTMVLKSKA